ncbi:hypothetical protein NL482_22900 [Klebsiella pneumoniae]|uniref:hypothetical protein n=1 Tax=Klebsiella TaxID=570 RepID=UPI00136C7A97|nr:MULTISPECIES: hypothetical protein [Klebsiella]HDU5769843.1 hypothetical protein [Klebsiella pneumoniae subsp. pneumoniae]MCG5551266.1 hypothetical protein [Klebsiella pneumoniae]MCG5559952.1 hypothetical protein [Klebsiella pneumoniae]MCH9359138.1 hypothetical protein [Klebsiella pneumoniae]MCP6417040.1 hypothetical protein [Klebsiella pneumoniae]
MSFQLTKTLSVNVTAGDGSVLETQEKDFVVTYRVDDISVNQAGTGTAWLQAYINGVTSGQPEAHSIRYTAGEGDVFAQAQVQLMALDKFAGATAAD